MSGEIRSLTGLRGVAATLVMVDHYTALDFSYRFPGNLLPHMYVAVDIFMILSGFVLAMVYEKRFAGGNVWAATALFLKHRVARLYPLFLVMTLVCFVLCREGWLTFLHPDVTFGGLAANLAGIQTWIWPWSSLDGPAWSISAEWAANLLFPLLMPLVLLGPALLAVATVLVALVVLVGSAVLFGSLFDVPAAGVVNVISGPQALGRCVPEFVFGMALWRLRSRAGWASVFAGTWVQVALLVG
ncbi:acyltransferase, partial [Acidisphaera sp. L21]|uniref:acyltransferase family protein n=1 Tax=Acidisphaera sp. L21 TaxID=1641851 RepID=UPI00131AEEDA